MAKKRREDTTPLIRPASVPIVTVKMVVTIKHPKSVQEVLQRGFSSANCLKREMRLTSTMADSEAFGMSLITSVRRNRQRIMRSGLMIL